MISSYLSDLFFNYQPAIESDGSVESATELLGLVESLLGQDLGVTPEELSKDYLRRL